jgi:Family of unknown function (DUF6878)
MTTKPTPPGLTFSFADIKAEIEGDKRRLAEARPANKSALFDALAAAGITLVEVRFDGCGDSGQIQEIRARAGDAAVDLPAQSVEFVQLGKSETIKHETMTVADAIEALVYDALEETHDGWEIDDGAYGDFTFDVANRTLTLDYNERHMESDYSHHEF